MSVLDFTSQLHRYSVDEYEQLVERGAFEDQRVELIDGLVLDMSPRSDRHENAVEWLVNRWLVRSLDFGRYSIRTCGSLRLATSEPEPDIAVVDSELRRRGHPAGAHLVIEVALSSRDRDLTLKPRLYAPTVAEYWVLDLQQDRLVVHRDPGEHGYGELTVHGRESMLRPQRLALKPLAVGELLDSI